MRVGDKSGVLADIARVLSDFDISIETILQKVINGSDKAMLLCSTHTCKEKQIKSAITELEKLDSVDEKITMIRIED
jgi:homoserine dehydrogenase